MDGDRPVANPRGSDDALPTTPFIDCHVHLWDLTAGHYAWLDEPGDQSETALLGDYKMIRSAIGTPRRLFREFYGSTVAGSVHVEAAYSGLDSVEETAWLDTVGREYGMPNALVVFTDLGRKDSEAVLDRHLAASDRVRGVRMRTTPDDPRSPAFRRGCAALAARRLSFELNASPGRLLSGRVVAIANPDVQVIVGHAGAPLQRDRAYFTWWMSEITELARVENVACKVSGLGMADHNWTLNSIRPWILHCIDAFGPDRVVFGTNWPVDALYSTYSELIHAYRAVLAGAGFSRSDQESMLFRNAERLYRIQ